MRPSENAIQAIKNRERCSLVSYRLPGEKHYTIGWGHYCDRTPTLDRAGARISQAQADAYLVQDVEEKTAYLNTILKTEVNQNLYDALVSTFYQYNSKNLYLRGIVQAINLGASVSRVAKMLMALPSNKYNKKARKVDALLATTGQVYHIDNIKV
ncbi:glycoside hydrolase family protein [Pedobacter jeongneungensis]|uniref:glycoside hydrolase family protein n=1 Tax=Pedobacter jeongneungensis TaxID=947309 RepID=UPI00046A7475|nr:glycoside hydrolase family protein [Pedobacter jeongneungensis]